MTRHQEGRDVAIPVAGFVVTEENFRKALSQRLGASFDRALTIFGNYGEYRSADVTNSLIIAAKKGKIGEVIGVLEEHWDKDLQYEDPEIRGKFLNTETMFIERIYKGILKLKPRKQTGRDKKKKK
jgi:hypothetical protein